MAHESSTRLFVGREASLSLLASAVDAARAGRAPLVLVSGEAGIGKSSLVAEAARRATGVDVGLGICWAGPGAPGYWPWTQALGELAATAGADTIEVPEADRRLLAGVIPAFGPEPAGAEQDAGRARLRLFDAVGRWLVRRGHHRPVMVVLDDLQWADTSSLELLDFLARLRPGPGVLLVGLHRHDELSPAASAVLGELTARSDHVQLGGLDAQDVSDLVAAVAGRRHAERWAAEVYRRSEGHPFFARELAHALPEAAAEGVPRAVRGAIQRRLGRLSPRTRTVIDAAALLGNRPRPDVVTGALEVTRQAVDDAVVQAIEAGVLSGGRDRPRFVHDLFRETVVESLPNATVTDMHRRLAHALEARHTRVGDVAPAEISRHFTAAVACGAPEAALRWALAAAAADQATLALTDAAAHLTRLREALCEPSVSVDDRTWVDLLVAEADALDRAGRPEPARGLLALARTRAVTARDPARVAAVAFGVQRLGARFAMPRREVVEILDAARRAAAGSDAALEARLTAAEARELRHSIPGPASCRTAERRGAVTGTRQRRSGGAGGSPPRPARRALDTRNRRRPSRSRARDRQSGRPFR